MQLLDGVKLCLLNELSRSKLKNQAAMSRFLQKLWNSVHQVWRSTFWGIGGLKMLWQSYYQTWPEDLSYMMIGSMVIKLCPINSKSSPLGGYFDQYLRSVLTLSLIQNHNVNDLYYIWWWSSQIWKKTSLYLFFQLIRTRKQFIMADLCSKASWVLSQFVIDLTDLALQISVNTYHTKNGEIVSTGFSILQLLHLAPPMSSGQNALVDFFQVYGLGLVMVNLF